MSFPEIFTAPAEIQVKRLSLPYGLWTCDDGRQIIFNRGYQPIWERPKNDGSRAFQADPKEWVKFCSQQYFYSDRTSPTINKETYRRCLRILDAFIEGHSVARYLWVKS